MKKISLYLFLFILFTSCGDSSTTPNPKPDPAENITVSFVTPTKSSEVYYNVTQIIEVKTSEDVKKVEIFLDGQSIGSSISSPYKINWMPKDLEPGTHKLTARASSMKNNEFNIDTDVNLKIRLGDDFKGGKVFSVDGSGAHGLIASVDDLRDSKGIGYYFIWGDYTLRGTSLDNGAENTKKVATAATYYLEMGYQFKGDGLKLNGFNDWYIPSLRELELLLDHKTNVGGFPADSKEATYWSSSESTAKNGFCLNFVALMANYNIKAVGARIRPIRKF